MKRIVLFCLLLSAASSAWPEDATAPLPAPASAGAPSAFGELKYRVLEAEARMDGSLYPAGDAAGTGAKIFYGNAAAHFAMHQVSVAVDGGAPAVVSLQDEDALALAGTGNLLWLDNVLLSPGPHRLQVEMQASDLSKQDHATQQFALDAQVQIEPGDSSVEFKLIAASLLSPAHVALILHKTDRRRPGWLLRIARSIGDLLPGADGNYFPGGAKDPTMRYVDYLVRRGKGDAAVVQLLGITQIVADQNSLSDKFWLKLSSALRLANLPDQAQAVCDRLDAENTAREAVGVERLRIGIEQYGLGDVIQAEKQLLSAQDRLPQYRVQDWQVAYAQILFSRGQYADARRVLQSGNVDSDDAFRYMLDSSEAVRTSNYRRFNLAVAMVLSGDEVRGLSLLDLVGRLRSSDGDLLTLRDKANLTLGWHFLQAKQGATAMGVLGRVRSEGQYSSAALLGMGWAELEPAGKKLTRARLGDTPDDDNSPLALPAPMRHSLSQLGILEPEMRGEVGPGSFTRDKPAANRNERLRRALKVWQVLADRDASESAVQEGMLAIAYAFDGLYEKRDARNAYARAVGALEAQKKTIADRVGLVRDGSLASAIAASHGDADLALVMGPLHLMPEDSTRLLYASIDRYRGLLRLQHDLTDYQTQISSRADRPALAGRAFPDIPALLEALGQAQQSEIEKFQTLAQAALEQQVHGIDDYLKVAYLGAARATDASLDSGRPD